MCVCLCLWQRRRRCGELYIVAADIKCGRTSRHAAIHFVGVHASLSLCLSLCLFAKRHPSSNIILLIMFMLTAMSNGC